MAVKSKKSIKCKVLPAQRFKKGAMAGGKDFIEEDEIASGGRQRSKRVGRLGRSNKIQSLKYPRDQWSKKSAKRSCDYFDGYELDGEEIGEFPEKRKAPKKRKSSGKKKNAPKKKTVAKKRKAPKKRVAKKAPPKKTSSAKRSAAAKKAARTRLANKAKRVAAGKKAAATRKKNAMLKEAKRLKRLNAQKKKAPKKSVAKKVSPKKKPSKSASVKKATSSREVNALLQATKTLERAIVKGAKVAKDVTVGSFGGKKKKPKKASKKAPKVISALKSSAAMSAKKPKPKHETLVIADLKVKLAEAKATTSQVVSKANEKIKKSNAEVDKARAEAKKAKAKAREIKQEADGCYNFGLGGKPIERWDGSDVRSSAYARKSKQASLAHDAFLRRLAKEQYYPRNVGQGTREFAGKRSLEVSDLNRLPRVIGYGGKIIDAKVEKVKVGGEIVPANATFMEDGL